jgi:IS4 transposase
MIPEFVAVTEGKAPDLTQGREFNFPKGSMVAFDKGYVDYSWYKSLTDKGGFFVTRLRPNSIYKVLERKVVDNQLGVSSDQIIQLNSVHTLKRGAPELRRVGFKDEDTGQRYVFLTNNFKLASTTILDIYKERWQVELFFKAIKQNLKIKIFIGTSKNAILTQIWISIITYLLLAFARHSAKTGWTIQHIMRVIQLNLFERRSLK